MNFDPDDYEVAIPSTGRASTVADHTVRTLLDGGVDAERITVWVSPHDDLEAYWDALCEYSDHLTVKVADHDPTDPGVDHVGDYPVGIGLARNKIMRHTDRGTLLLFADDDIDGLFQAVDRRTRTPLDNLHSFIANSFLDADLAGATLWGVYPSANPYFMQIGKAITHLCLIPGGFYGIRVFHDGTDETKLDEKDDYERSIRRWERDGSVYRHQSVGMHTKVYRGGGGLQTAGKAARIERAALSSRWLIRHWPGFVQTKHGASGYPEIKLAPVSTSR